MKKNYLLGFYYALSNTFLLTYELVLGFMISKVIEMFANKTFSVPFLLVPMTFFVVFTLLYIVIQFQISGHRSKYLSKQKSSLFRKLFYNIHKISPSNAYCILDKDFFMVDDYKYQLYANFTTSIIIACLNLLLMVVQLKAFAIIFLFLSLINILPFILIYKKKEVLTLNYLKYYEVYQQSLREIFHGIALIRRYNLHITFKKEIESSTHDLKNAMDKILYLNTLEGFLKDSMSYISLFLVILTLIFMNYSHLITDSNAILCIFLFVSYSNSLKQIIELLIDQVDYKVSKNRILSTQTNVHTEKKDFTLSKKESIPPSNINFVDLSINRENTTLKYPQINLSLAKTQKIVGQNGSGKTSLILYLLKKLDQSDGEIFIDQQCLKTISSDAITQYFSSCSQTPVFVSEDAYSELCHTANSIKVDYWLNYFKVDFILKKEATNFDLLSGGQKQVLNLIRTLSSDAHILIFDEPLNYLDSEKIALVNTALKEINKPIIFIDHSGFLTSLDFQEVILHAL